MTTIERYKDDIADRYIQDFKKELGFFDKIMIAPIFTKMKIILKSDKKIDVNNFKDLEDLWFWRNVLGIRIWEKQLFENLVNKTFSFLKEKQEKIIQAQTEWRLDELLNLVVNWKLDVLEQRVDGSNNNQNENGNNQDIDSSIQDQNDSQEIGNGGQKQENNTQDKNNGNKDQKNANQNENDNKQKNNEWVNPIVPWTAAWVVTAATYRKTLSLTEKKLWINSLKQAPEEFNAQETKKMLNKLSSQMSEKLNSWVKMNRAQKAVYKKSIKQFDEAAKSLDWETAEAFKAWQKLQDRVSPKLLKSVGGDMKTLKLIESLPDEELAKIAGKSEKEIVEFFKLKNITISDDIAKQLKVLKNANEIRWLTRILKNWTKLRNFIRWIKWMWTITFLFAWVDIRSYFDSKKEAELVSKINEIRWKVLKDKASAQLIIWLWSIGAEALWLAIACAAWCSVTWPIWMAIWAAIWLLAGAASMAYDELYANKKEFYAQNRYDFINQKRTKIKQSIVQLFESDRLNMNEWMKESIKDDRGPNSEINTMEDAWEALIYQEEIMEWGFDTLQRYYSSWESEESFIKTLSDEEKKQYEKEKKEMEDIINLRMKYIKQYVKEDKNSPEYNEMKKAVTSLKWMEYVEQLLANSKVHSYLKTDHENAYISNYKQLDIEWYKKAYKAKLSNEYKTEFDIFEKLRNSNPSVLQEICEWVLVNKSIIESRFDVENNWDENDTPTYTADEIKKLKKNIDFIEKYNEYLNLAVPMEKKTNTLASYNTDYLYIEQVLLDLNSINKRPIWDEERSMKYLSCDFKDDLWNVDAQVSNCTFQNVLYSIAREIHGYTWSNDMFELSHFYTWDGDNTWIYMHDGFRINDDTGFWFFGAKDEKIDITKITKDQAIKMIVKEVDLDSPIESADESLTQEFRKRVQKIIDREYWYIDKKKEYEKEIIDFIKTNNSNEKGYVQLPSYLAMNAKRAWIGDINRFLFRIENSQIYALSRGDMVNTVLHFDNDVNIKYESMSKTGKELTPEEKQLINYVDDAEKKLNKLRRKQWHFIWLSEHEDDLDIPVELERAISQKSIEWKNIKEWLLYMQPLAAQNFLAEKSKEYYRYFNWLYLWLLNTVTWMDAFLNSNDINDSEHFLQVENFIWIDGIVTVKDWKLEINNIINESIREHLLELFDLYKDKNTGKTVKELLLDKENEENQARWQEIAKKIYELCLEQAVLKFDDNGNVTSIDITDFSNKNLQAVKNKLSGELDWIWFHKANDRYRNWATPSRDPKFSKRLIEKAETDSHKEVGVVVKNIINTMNEVDRAGKRGTPKFEADEKQWAEWKIMWTLSSWWYSEKITVNMDNTKNAKSITIDWLWMSFSNIQEWFRIANFINWIKNNVKEYPYWKSANDRRWGTYWLYHWANGWDLERDIDNNANDVNILDVNTIDKYYPSVKDNEKFLKYINSFVK